MKNAFDLKMPSAEALKRSHLLSQVIQQTIDAQQGFISFATYMDLALYEPRWGYYQSADFTIGQAGDFTTASHISPLYAQCFAQQCAQICQSLDQACILELGAGTGVFAHTLLTTLAQLGITPHYYIYEVSAALKHKQQQVLQHHPKVTWLSQLPSALTGIIIANEVLDALPVHCFTLTNDGIAERGVTGHQQRFTWQTKLATNELLIAKVEPLRHRYHLPCDYQSEINLQLPELIKQLSASLTQGVMLFADYGYGQAEYYHPERRHGSLTCFYEHHHHDQPLLYPGLQDMTAHVDFTAVAEAGVANGCTVRGYTTQAGFLFGCGLMELAATAETSLTVTQAYALHQAIKTLTLPTEMGERIKIMALTKQFEHPLRGFQWQDRKRDL